MNNISDRRIVYATLITLTTAFFIHFLNFITLAIVEIENIVVLWLLKYMNICSLYR